MIHLSLSIFLRPSFLFPPSLSAPGGEITSTFDHPELVKLGHCKLIEEVMIGEDTLIHFSGVSLGEACTIVLRGATQQILDEAERSLHDALCVLAQTVKETRTVFGGGEGSSSRICIYLHTYTCVYLHTDTYTCVYLHTDTCSCPRIFRQAHATDTHTQIWYYEGGAHKSNILSCSFHTHTQMYQHTLKHSFLIQAAQRC